MREVVDSVPSPLVVKMGEKRRKKRKAVTGAVDDSRQQKIPLVLSPQKRRELGLDPPPRSAPQAAGEKDRGRARKKARRRLPLPGMDQVPEECVVPVDPAAEAAEFVAPVDPAAAKQVSFVSV